MCVLGCYCVPVCLQPQYKPGGPRGAGLRAGRVPGRAGAGQGSQVRTEHQTSGTDRHVFNVLRITCTFFY